MGFFVGRSTGFATGEGARLRKTAAQPSASSATRTAEVKVLFELTGLGMTYAEDANSTRYLIDEASQVTFKLKKGQRLSATVNRDGYVLAAKLLPQ